jgi:hypothetical protein
MGFLDRILGRGRKMAGDLTSGSGLRDPGAALEQEAEAAQQRVESAPEQAEAQAQRKAQSKVEGRET